MKQKAFSLYGRLAALLLAAPLLGFQVHTAEPTNSFFDVPADAWYAPGVSWAQEVEITSGYGGGRFGPNDPVTREQMAAILWRYTGSPKADTAAPFADRERISPWAAPAADWTASAGVIATCLLATVRPPGCRPPSSWPAMTSRTVPRSLTRRNRNLSLYQRQARSLNSLPMFSSQTDMIPMRL